MKLFFIFVYGKQQLWKKKVVSSEIIFIFPENFFEKNKVQEEKKNKVAFQGKKEKYFLTAKVFTLQLY